MARYELRVPRQLNEGRLRRELELALLNRVSLVCVLEDKCIVEIDPDRDGDLAIVERVIDLHDGAVLYRQRLISDAVSASILGFEESQVWAAAVRGEFGTVE